MQQIGKHTSVIDISSHIYFHGHIQCLHNPSRQINCLPHIDRRPAIAEANNDEQEQQVEDDAPLELEMTKPLWDTPGWLDETLLVEGFSPQVVVKSTSDTGEEPTRTHVALNAEQLKVLGMVVDEGKNVFFTGSAGASLYVVESAGT